MLYIIYIIHTHISYGIVIYNVHTHDIYIYNLLSKPRTIAFFCVSYFALIFSVVMLSNISDKKINNQNVENKE